MYFNHQQRKLLKSLCCLYIVQDCALSHDTISKLIYRVRTNPKFSSDFEDTINILYKEIHK